MVTRREKSSHWRWHLTYVTSLIAFISRFPLPVGRLKNLHTPSSESSAPFSPELSRKTCSDWVGESIAGVVWGLPDQSEINGGKILPVSIQTHGSRNVRRSSTFYDPRITWWVSNCSVLLMNSRFLSIENDRNAAVKYVGMNVLKMKIIHTWFKYVFQWNITYHFDLPWKYNCCFCVSI